MHCTSYLEMNCKSKMRLSKLRDDCIQDCGRFFGWGTTDSLIWLNDILEDNCRGHLKMDYITSLGYFGDDCIIDCLTFWGERRMIASLRWLNDVLENDCIAKVILEIVYIPRLRELHQRLLKVFGRGGCMVLASRVLCRLFGHRTLKEPLSTPTSFCVKFLKISISSLLLNFFISL